MEKLNFILVSLTKLIGLLIASFTGLILLGDESSLTIILRGRDVIGNYIKSSALDSSSFKLLAWLMHIVSGLSFSLIVICWISYYLNLISYT